MGRSVGRKLAEKGASVIIVARDHVRLKEANAYISVRAHPRTPPQLAKGKLKIDTCRKAR